MKTKEKKHLEKYMVYQKSELILYIFVFRLNPQGKNGALSTNSI